MRTKDKVHSFHSKGIRIRILSLSEKLGTLTMNNHSANVTVPHQQEIETSKSLLILFLSVQCFALCLQLAVQFTIHKARLRDNSYQLIRILSFIESLYLATVIIIGADVLINYKQNPNEILLTVLSFSGYLWHTLSLIASVLISIDRWIAVKWCLRYHIFVTKRTILAVVLTAAALDLFILFCMFVIGGVTNTILSNKSIFTNRVVMGYAALIRTIACIFMLAFDKKTIQYRNESEDRMRSINNLHGTQAEELNFMNVLKRGIKDVLKVNIWKCIFLLPMTFVLFIIVFGIEIPEWIFGINTILISAYMISNPIIYLTCYTKLRNFWTRLFRRQRTVPEEA